MYDLLANNVDITDTPAVGLTNNVNITHNTACPGGLVVWSKPLLIGHSACLPDGLRTLGNPGSNPRMRGDPG